MTPKTRIQLPLVLVAAVLFGLLTFLPLDPILYAARFVALVSVAHLIWRYHRLADWSQVEIGRSTMAIKGAILVIAFAANVRTVDDIDGATLDHAANVAASQGWMHALAEVGIVLGWLCMAAALVHRDRLVVRYQGEAHALPAPPPPHHMPSEEVKQEPT